MTAPDDLPLRDFPRQDAYRLVNGKYPPIDIFDDVADQGDFDALYAVQALTNPRLQMMVGELHLVPEHRRPWGIPGCNYALGPFVHPSRDGSRFSDGHYGVFYCAERMATAIAETRYHQERYFRNVPGLKYDRLVMRGLRVRFSARLRDIHNPYRDDAGWYHPDDYGPGRRLGRRLHEADEHGLAYGSVRHRRARCFALLSPHLIEAITPATHYEYIWDGERIAHVLTIRRLAGGGRLIAGAKRCFAKPRLTP